MIIPRIGTKHISWLDIVVVLLMAVALYRGASWQYFATNDDATRYQCYTQAFWHGLDSVHSLGVGHCKFLLHPDQSIVPITHDELVSDLRRAGLPAGIVNFVDAQSTQAPFHALPYEYPMLTLVPFTIAMITAPTAYFQISYSILMILLAAATYFILLHWTSRKTAVGFAILLVMGGWGTVAGRFDLVPAAFTLFAVMCADRKRWNWAFFLLALAVLYKYYPVLLLLPFLIVQLRESAASWLSWKRWQPLLVFVLCSVVVMGASLLLSVQGTISPFLYLGNRPVQVESLASSFLWISSKLITHSAQYAYTFGSLNILASGGRIISLLMTVIEVAGFFFILWLLWKRRINLSFCCLLILLLIIITGKVFSPQYLIWIIPLVAYLSEGKISWVSLWSLVGFLTMLIYPVIYNEVGNIVNVPFVPLFFPTVTLRNLLLLGFAAYLLYGAVRQKPVELLVPEEPDPSLDVKVVKSAEM